MLKVFKSIDGFFVRLNDRTTGGMVLMKDYTSLPLFDPVAWRERSKKSLGKARYLFRILVVMEGPTLFICVGAATVSARSDFSGLRDLLLLVWGIVAMILAMKGATIISAERVRETLDALLSTPLTAKEILTQKVAGMQRLMIVLAIPIFSVHFTLLLLNVDFRVIMSSRETILIVVWYTVGFILTTFLTMQILAWLAVLFGLRSQSQSRSAMTGICLIAGWVIVSSFLGRPGGYVFEAFSNICQSIQQGDSSRSGSENNETPTMQLNQTIAAVICCMIRADGGIQANEGVLVAVGNPYVEKTELYYAPSRSIHAALTVATVVFLWQVLLVLLIRMLTLRLGASNARSIRSGVRIPHTRGSAFYESVWDNIGNDRMNGINQTKISCETGGEVWLALSQQGNVVGLPLTYRSTPAGEPRCLVCLFGVRSVKLLVRQFLQFCILLFPILWMASALGQVTPKIRIADKIWGFDGRVMNGQFMPLSIELDNLSDEPIEAQATLRSITGMLRETGGTATQPIFLSPHSRALGAVLSVYRRYGIQLAFRTTHRG